MTTAVIVQARMTSTRLPGKILAPVLGGRPMMSVQLERLHRTREADAWVVATTTNAADDPVARLAESMGWTVTRGSEDDVLGRYWAAAEQVGADIIVRSTADCPLIDPLDVDEGIRRYSAMDVDYLVPLALADGMGFEVFSRRMLETMAWVVSDPEEREHVTLNAYRHPERYRIAGYEVVPDRTGQRWTVDTAEDLALVTRILETLWPSDPQFTNADVGALMDAHPEWWAINAHVQQAHAQEVSELYVRVRANS